MRDLILFISFALRLALLAPCSPATDMLLDTSRPSVYIEHEQFAAPSNATGQAPVWLRLHNNTRWAVSIRTESLYVGDNVQPLRLMNGKGVLAIRSGITVSPCYAVEEIPGESSSTTSHSINEEPYRRLRLGNACTVGSTSWIPSGGTIRFHIPSEHLSLGRRISIDFEYEWENARSVEHRVLFVNSKAVR